MEACVKERKRLYKQKHYAKVRLDPERYARFCAQKLAYYHRIKGGHKVRAWREKQNARRRKGPARGNYGPRTAQVLPEIRDRAEPRVRYAVPVTFEPAFQ